MMKHSIKGWQPTVTNKKTIVASKKNNLVTSHLSIIMCQKKNLVLCDAFLNTEAEICKLL